jgi:hypothetical protein
VQRTKKRRLTGERGAENGTQYPTGEREARRATGREHRWCNTFIDARASCLFPREQLREAVDARWNRWIHTC